MSKFTNSESFPSFYELPSASQPASRPSAKQQSPTHSHVLLAQIKENMTITKPTLIVTDRQGVDFALLFEDNAFSLKGFRKGYTVAVPGAVRTDRDGEEGGAGDGTKKKAVVRVKKGEDLGVKVIPGTLDRVLELGVVLAASEDEAITRKCGACGSAEAALMKCTGCGVASYCRKECQVKGWSEMDHKSNCKALKVLRVLP
ncbi:hypothetical protein F5Y16DRAFT_130733 [Xylariaceae sp. FL0255]|nr:hypothetical protein F5Y16DRAFT_130733 [Xylariaceae sp. FL0255]